MKRYKTNSFATISLYTLEIGLPFCIAIPLMIFFLGGDRYSAGEILSTVPMTFFGMLGVAAFFYALNIFTLPFKKHVVFLEENTFEYNGEVFEYGSVTEIKINSGNLSRVHSFNTPCSLEIYSHGCLQTEIKSPSFLMIFALARKCKGAKLRYKNIMRALIMLLITVGVCFMIATVK